MQKNYVKIIILTNYNSQNNNLIIRSFSDNFPSISQPLFGLILLYLLRFFKHLSKNTLKNTAIAFKIQSNGTKIKNPLHFD
ncbi:hypothetical protein Q764_00775 [Flavobacterium suncheonense GH29-5 = DSM 17707]|uniref:Uncharacterized protein n=1 Tax=Flavobacterium suncheonense GH29-5 = DSM 17707 TaxID=1121899 RepID=A0A0A2MEL2_9FLAO|nr:hypothetical protein Q764_00775 [Flavobacterium suncheonense GH29-5 = DSM 17707]